MNAGSNPNPYAAPTADVDSPGAPLANDFVLATRLSRLGAGLLDGLLALLAMSPMLIAGVAITVKSRMPEGNDSVGPLAIGGLILGGLAVLALVVFQLYRLSTTGQTLGKKWVGVRVVKTNGVPVTFSSAVALRAIVPGLIGAVPYVGWIFSLVDIFFIFREDRRCVHDLIADTRVVDVQ